ncbi:cell wall-associated hydrolase, invasion-associated protein [Desulfosporosinus acidiphilus SJ4]|uniref:Cell wall-associated hydrolase, invasion-associated protein n=1 Tax=Desulfosporosinus acidiphilus (strain DSM 22704 / JCM 16185 / SJ4) TaxID=646529 RepID=I4D4P2_DESAJ|nr:NlpC/P60 family protein [Desulfosporosinus acidiphilus]AFM40766.1 cell wall-associated hydrolase, invasion-associated protein [Desulfosporosinus acidiphilus SJ4]
MKLNFRLKQWNGKFKLAAASTLVFTSLVTFVPVVQAATLMKLGSRGNDVITLQKELNNLNYSVGTADGIFGSKTLSAVEAFQQNDHLQVDGIAGPITQDALEKAQSQSAQATQATQAIQSTAQATQAAQSAQATQTSNTNPIVSRIISEANSLLGTPYLWGGTTPKGFDCSGFTQYVYASQGIVLPRTSQEQGKTGTAVTYHDLKSGDLVFFSIAGNGTIDHVGIYLGNSQFISATTHKGVAVYPLTSSYWLNTFIGAQRVL